MHDDRRYLHYGKVTLETARKLQVTVERPFSGRESLGETGSAHPDPPKTALQGR